MSSTYTVEDLDRVINEGVDIPSYSGGTYRSGGEDLWSLLKWSEVTPIVTKLGTISYVADHGGEGEGDQYWVVVKVTGHDGSERYFKRLGWYASHYGGELDGPTVEVHPREKMVTVYEV